MSPGAHRLLDQIRSRRSRAGVVGLGYVGLPLGMELARAAFDTTGIDVDPRKVEAVYKRDIDDLRESPSLDVMAVLTQKGAVLAQVDCVVILTDHRLIDAVA